MNEAAGMIALFMFGINEAAPAIFRFYAAMPRKRCRLASSTELQCLFLCSYPVTITELSRKKSARMSLGSLCTSGVSRKKFIYVVMFGRGPRRRRSQARIMFC